MPTLDLLLFGHPQIFVEGSEVTNFNTRKDRALLVYLAMTGTAHSREHLAGLLWPDVPEGNALRNLRHALSHLRKVIGAAWIEADHNISLTQNLPWQVDVQTLRSAVRDVTKLSTDKIDQPTADALYDVLTLYRGEFLQGFYLQKADLFEAWVVTQREETNLLAMRGLELVAQYHLTHGLYENGLGATRRLLQLDPWSETAYRLQMQLLAHSGQRGAALIQYEQCRQILADELGVEPMPETTALYHEIQAGTFKELRLQKAPMALEPPSEVKLLANELPSSKSVIPHNLLTPLAKFIGRADELAFISERLAAADCRLLTIIGPGGMGKSSLALAAGQRLLDSHATYFPDGIFFVALAGTEIGGDNRAGNANPEMLIVTTIAESIGCQFQGSQPVQAQLQAYLRPRRLLLILDNFEQLAEYTGITDIIVTVLTNAPQITMLITSRVRLNVRGEITLVLKGLSLLATGDGASFDQDSTWQASEAVTLFVERAQRLDANFVTGPETIGLIAQICQAIEGLPLALEMIAAWVNLYSCAEIAEKLTREEEKADLLVSQFLDQPKRHQTLQRVFDDSWDLLPVTVQWALARLSIFSRQFPRQAAQTIAEVTLSDLMHLRNHSLLQNDADNSYSLHPLIKQFAAQKWQQLAQQQPQQPHRLQQAHSRYYLHWVADLTALRGRELVEAIQAYQKSHIEIARGWQWAVQQEDRTLLQHSMVGLFRYLELTNQTSAGKALFGMVSTEANDPTTIWLQVGQCHFLRRLAEHDQARKSLEALVTMLAAMHGEEDESGHQEAGVPSVTLLGTHIFALVVLGWVYYEQGNYDAAQNCFATAQIQAETTTDHAYMMETHNGLGAVAFSTKAYATAQQHYQAALIYTQQQADLHYTAIVLGNLAALAQATNAYDEAEEYLHLRLQIDQQTQNVRQMAVSYQRLGQLALLRDAYATAETHFHKSLAQVEQLGHSSEIAHVLLDLSKSLLRQNQLQQAEAQCLRSLQLAIQAQMTPRILAALTLLAEIRIAEGKKAEAVTLLQMVNQNPQIPAAALKTAQKLQAALVAELGEDAFGRINQEIAQKSLQEFGLQLLRIDRD